MLWNTQSTLNMLWLRRVATIAVRPVEPKAAMQEELIRMPPIEATAYVMFITVCVVEFEELCHKHCTNNGHIQAMLAVPVVAFSIVAVAQTKGSRGHKALYGIGPSGWPQNYQKRYIYKESHGSCWACLVPEWRGKGGNFGTWAGVL